MCLPGCISLLQRFHTPSRVNHDLPIDGVLLSIQADATSCLLLIANSIVVVLHATLRQHGRQCPSGETETWEPTGRTAGTPFVLEAVSEFWYVACHISQYSCPPLGYNIKVALQTRNHVRDVRPDVMPPVRLAVLKLQAGKFPFVRKLFQTNRPAASVPVSLQLQDEGVPWN